MQQQLLEKVNILRLNSFDTLEDTLAVLLTKCAQRSDTVAGLYLSFTNLITKKKNHILNLT